MKTIVTLGPNIRLVVFQFLISKQQIPAIIQPKRNFETPPPPLPLLSGVEVFKSTPGIDISRLIAEVGSGTSYELVDVWQKFHERNWLMSFVRFVYCRKEYINRTELHPEFVTKRAELTKVLTELVSKNLWATQGHLNPYLEKDGSRSSHQVMMFGSAGRKPMALASQLHLVGDKIVFTDQATIQALLTTI